MKRVQGLTGTWPCPKRFKTASPSAPLRQRTVSFRQVKDYILGPRAKGLLNCLQTYLAKKGDSFYKIKMLIMDHPEDFGKVETSQGSMLFHNELTILELLKGCQGIEQVQEMFVDYVQDDRTKPPQKTKKRIVMVLDAWCDKASENWMNVNEVNFQISLQEYISRYKVSEREALTIFYEMVKIVEFIHSRNIIHRDLKLQHFLINLKTRRVTLTNFCLGKLLTSENQLLYDQRGSPAYVSPDILIGPYRGKPSDIWTLGVILYLLVYSTFPFVDNTTANLFKKIRHCDFSLPTDGVKVSESTKRLIKDHLLTLNADRYTATEVRECLERQFEKIQRTNLMAASLNKTDQVVPDINEAPVEEPPKLICSDPPSPKYELSTEPISMILKMMSPTNEHNAKMFLKPSLLAERRNRISGPPTNSTSPSGSNVGLTRTLTRQINNLTVRNRQHNSNTGLSWHNRISGPSMYEVRFRSSVGSMMVDRSRVQQRATGVQHISGGNASFDAIYSTLNELFSSGNFPSNAIVHEFHGNINQDIALKLSIWLRTNFHDNELVREIYQSTHSPGDDIGKFVEFLRRCHVEMEMTSGQVFVKAQQTSQILVFMTYLLQLAGYNNNYFLNISRNA